MSLFMLLPLIISAVYIALGSSYEYSFAYGTSQIHHSYTSLFVELDYNNVLGKRNGTEVIINKQLQKCYVVCTMQLYSVLFPRARIKSHLSPDYWFKSLLLPFFVELK